MEYLPVLVTFLLIAWLRETILRVSYAKKLEAQEDLLEALRFELRIRRGDDWMRLMTSSGPWECTTTGITLAPPPSRVVKPNPREPLPGEPFYPNFVGNSGGDVGRGDAE